MSLFAFYRRNSILQAIVLLHMLVYALVPAGFMPGQVDQDGFALVICTPEGMKTLSDPKDAAEDETGFDGLCHWAGRDIADNAAGLGGVAGPMHCRTGPAVPHQGPILLAVALHAYDSRAPPVLT